MARGTPAQMALAGRVSTSRAGVRVFIEPCPDGTNQPLRSTTRSVGRSEYRQTRAEPSSLTMVALAMLRPGSGLRFEANGRPASHGQAVTNPGVSVLVDVRLSTAPTVPPGARPGPVTCRAMVWPAANGP